MATQPLHLTGASALLYEPFHYGITASNDLRSYDPQKVNSLPHVHNGILDKDIDREVRVLLETIQSHGLENELAVWRTHRHFDINENEQIVTTLDAENNSLVTHVIEKETCDCVPIMWSLSKEGTWHPMQFWTGKESDTMKNRLKILEEKRDFLDEYAKTLKQMDAESSIGISIRQDDFLGAIEGYSLVEGTRENIRYQVVRNVSDEKVDEHFQRNLKKGEPGKTSITHWPCEYLRPREIKCTYLGCVICGIQGSCYSHWPEEDASATIDQFRAFHIPRFFELIKAY
ncbi:MAG: hypothetical protein KR126chlam1_00571 [Chlamydiae bacterium]|nr:hypothetical protein [Chlamydiota bacterium]